MYTYTYIYTHIYHTQFLSVSSFNGFSARVTPLCFFRKSTTAVWPWWPWLPLWHRMVPLGSLWWSSSPRATWTLTGKHWAQQPGFGGFAPSLRRLTSGTLKIYHICQGIWSEPNWNLQENDVQKQWFSSGGCNRCNAIVHFQFGELMI